MAKRAGRAAGLIALVLAAAPAFACSNASDGEDDAGETGGTGGTTPDPCPSSPCTCVDGRTSELACSRDASNTCSCSSQCDCSACPEFEVDESPPFDACGGDPTGIWRSIVFAPQGFHLSNLGTSGGECPADFTMASPDLEFLLSFAETAELEVYRSAFSVSGNMLDSCIREVFQGTWCNALDIANDGSCLLGECGICSCTLPVLELEGTGSWSSTGGRISVSLGTGERGSFEHCVQVDRLVLREPSGIRFELERIQVTGTPTPCAQRTNETCTMGNSCTWDGASCSGAVSATCSLEDYGNVPGCEFVP